MSSKVPVRPLSKLSSVDEAVTPASMLSSEVVKVAPSKIFNSVAEAVTWLPAINRVVALADPLTSKLY